MKTSWMLEVFAEFERGFGRLSMWDQVILAPEKVAMFLRAVDSRDRHDLGILLEDVTTESGLKEEWDVVRSNVSRFTKRKQWLRSVEETRESELTHKHGEQSRPSEVGTEKPSNLTVMQQLLKGFEDLKIAVVKVAERPAAPRFKDPRCM